MLVGNMHTEPAVGVFNDKKLKFLLPIDEALRLANELADAVESHSTGRR